MKQLRKMENRIGSGSKYEAIGMKSTHVDPHSTKILDGRPPVVLVNYLHRHLLVFILLGGKAPEVLLGNQRVRKPSYQWV